MHTEFRLGNILKKLYLGDRNRNEVIILTWYMSLHTFSSVGVLTNQMCHTFRPHLAILKQILTCCNCCAVFSMQWKWITS
jgi:hypothetical protein